MSDQDGLVGKLQDALDRVASPRTREWWEKYLRYVIRFRGVAIPEIRSQLAQWRGQYCIAVWEKEDQLQLALKLFESDIAEDKLAGILFLQEYLYDQFAWGMLLPKYEQLYQRNLIFDWNICDWFCVRVLGQTIAKNDLLCAQAIATWRNAEHLWQARSSVVAFVPVAKDSQYDSLIFESCEVLIQRGERFAKTAVGWILRDLSKRNPDCVKTFVQAHLDQFSAESLKNALKYLNRDEQGHYLQQLKLSRHGMEVGRSGNE